MADYTYTNTAAERVRTARANELAKQAAALANCPTIKVDVRRAGKRRSVELGQFDASDLRSIFACVAADVSGRNSKRTYAYVAGRLERLDGELPWWEELEPFSPTTPRVYELLTIGNTAWVVEIHAIEVPTTPECGGRDVFGDVETVWLPADVDMDGYAGLTAEAVAWLDGYCHLVGEEHVARAAVVASRSAAHGDADLVATTGQHHPLARFEASDIDYLIDYAGVVHVYGHDGELAAAINSSLLYDGCGYDYVASRVREIARIEHQSTRR